MAESVVKAEAPPRPFVLIGPFWRSLVEMALAEAASPAGRPALRSAVRFEETVSGAVAAAFENEPRAEALARGLVRHLAEGGDPLRDRRMRREQVRDEALLAR